MKINSFCLTCLIQMQEAQVREFIDEEKKMQYMREVLAFLSSCNPDLSAPALIRPLSRIYQKYWGVQSGLDAVKKEFNDYLLSLEEDIEAEIRAHREPLAASLLYARTGNYIDYASVKDISKEKLLELFENQARDGLDAREYKHFLDDLSQASSLKLLKEQYPHLSIQVIVRGAPVVNDADLDTAVYVGLDKIVPVMGNGSSIAGTDPDDISDEALRAIEEADLVISKGQGNFETLHGCGLNVYYLFLCKCDWFVRRFQAKRFQGMFLNERRIDPTDRK